MKRRRNLTSRLQNGERHEKAEKVEKSEDAAEAHCKKQKSRNIICLAYQQGKNFKRFKGNAKFSNLCLPFLI